MDALTAFYMTCHDYPGGCESLAPRMGMTPAVLRNKCNLRIDSNKPLLIDADRAMAITGDHRILHALADTHGYVLVSIDRASPSQMTVIELTMASWQAGGDVGAAIKAALEDGRIDSREMRSIREAVYQQTQVMQQLLMELEGIRS